MTEILTKDEASKLEFFEETKNKDIYTYILPNSKYWTVIYKGERILVDKKLKTLYIKEKCGIMSGKLDSNYYFYYDIINKKDILDGKKSIFAFNFSNKCIDGLEYLDENLKWHLIINGVDVLENKEVATVKDIFDNGVYYYPEYNLYNFKDKSGYWNLVRIKDDTIVFRNEMIKVFPPDDFFEYKTDDGEIKKERFDKYII